MRLFRKRPPTIVGRPIFDLDRLATGPRDENMELIRALCSTAYVGAGTALCRVLGRYKMYVDASDVGLSSHLMLDGYWEIWISEFLVGRVKRGMTAVDVGANVGYFTMLMADLVGNAGTVHAFEPNPPIAARLGRTAHVNGFRERVSVHATGLGEQDGERFMLVVPENYPGGASLVPPPAVVPDGAELLAVRRLDSYAELLDADIIKIDAEGSEEAIWKGMTGILEAGRPIVILLEFVLVRYRDADAFLDDLDGYGFSLNYIDHVTGLRPVDRAGILGRPAEDDIMLVLIR